MKQPVRWFWVALVLVLAVGIGLASAQTEQGARGGPMLKCQERFEALDVNRDGVVTRDEFMAVPHPGGHAEEIFRQRDLDGDGKLTKEEFCSGKGMGKGPGKGRMGQY